jgi:hypothetical protein
LLKRVEGLSSNYGLPIDRKGGCRLHPQLAADRGLVFYELGVFTRIEAGIELLRIQAHVGGKFLQVVLGEGSLVFSILMGKQVVMEIPEGILIAGALRSLSRPL